MLEKSLIKDIEEINERKKELLEINKDLLEQSISIDKSRINFINSRLASADDITEDEKNELINEKIEIEKNIEKVTADMEKENKEIMNIGSDLNIHNNKYKTIYEVIDMFNEKIKEDENNEKYKYYKKLLESTIEFDKIKEFRVNRNNTYLRKNYEKFANELQNKIGKNAKFVFPSCYQLKKTLKEFLKEVKPNLTDNEINKRSKEYASYIILHLSKINMNKDGIYVYYFMENIYKANELPIEQQLEYKSNIINMLDKNLMK